MASLSNDEVHRLQDMEHDHQQLSIDAMSYPAFNLDVFNSRMVGLFPNSNTHDSAHSLDFSPFRSRPHRYSTSVHYDDNLAASASSYNTREGSSVTLSDDSNILRFSDHPYTSHTMRDSFIPSVDSHNSIHSLAQIYSDPSFWHQNIPEHHSSSSYTLSPKKNSMHLDIGDRRSVEGQDSSWDGNGHPDNYYNKMSTFAEGESTVSRITATGSLDYSNHALDLLMMSDSFLSKQQGT